MTSVQRAPSADDSPQPDRPRRARRIRIPAPLAILLAVALVEALAWACLMPPLQGPDEVGHVSYTQKIAEAGSIPWQAVGGAPPTGTRPTSTEVSAALEIAGIEPSWANPSGEPAGTRVDEQMWAARERGFTDAQRADGGFTSSMRNPPAYYLYEALPYLATSSSSLFTRAFAMRLANLPLLVVLVAFTWLVAGELLGRSRVRRTIATAAVALQPQVVHMAATVNPDIALAAIWAAALYLMLRLLRAGLSPGRVAWLALLVALSSLTQPRGLALLIPAVAAVAIAAWRARPPATRRARRAIAGALGATYLAGVVAIVSYAAVGDPTQTQVRRFASYVWQFYLPRLGFMTPSISPDWGVRQAFLDRLFGGFVQLEVNPPGPVLDAIGIGLLVVVASCLIGAVARRRALARRWDVALVLALAVAGYLFLLHAVAFRSLLSGPDPIITGRYLLVLIPLYGAAIAFAVTWPRRAAVTVPLGVIALAAMTVVQLEAFGLLFARFYA